MTTSTNKSASAGKTTLIKNVAIIDPLVKQQNNGSAQYILVRDGIIEQVGEWNSSSFTLAADEVFDGKGMFAMPGFVNAHYHSHDVLLKGSFDVMSLERWAIRSLPRFYKPRSDRELRVRTLIGVAECLRGGISTVQDMLSIWPLTAHQATIVRDAYEESGIRAVLGMQLADRGMLDTMPFLRDILPPELVANTSGPDAPDPMPDQLAELEQLLNSRPNSENGLVSLAVCPSSPERCSKDLLIKLNEIAQKFNLNMFCHVAISRVEAVAAIKNFASSSGSPIKYLKDLGLLHNKLTLVHGVWLTEEDISLIKESGARVVLNPMSNLKVRNGVPPINSYMQSGISLGLGCDNFSCSDAQNMFQAMKLSVFMAGLESKLDTCLPGANQALYAATVGGAHAIGMEKSIGSIKPGMQADITFIDKNDTVFRPLNNPVRQMVYGESGRGVIAVMVGGKFLLKDRKLLTINEVELDRELAEIMPDFRAETKEIIAKVAPLDKYLTEMESRAWDVDVGLQRMLVS